MISSNRGNAHIGVESRSHQGRGSPLLDQSSGVVVFSHWKRSQPRARSLRVVVDVIDLLESSCSPSAGGSGSPLHARTCRSFARATQATCHVGSSWSIAGSRVMRAAQGAWRSGSRTLIAGSRDRLGRRVLPIGTTVRVSA